MDVRSIVKVPAGKELEYFRLGLVGSIVFCGHHRIQGEPRPTAPSLVMGNLVDIEGVHPEYNDYKDRKEIRAAGGSVVYRYGPEVWQARIPLDSIEKVERSTRGRFGLVECQEGPCSLDDIREQARLASQHRGWR